MLMFTYTFVMADANSTEKVEEYSFHNYYVMSIVKEAVHLTELTY